MALRDLLNEFASSAAGSFLKRAGESATFGLTRYPAAAASYAASKMAGYDPRFEDVLGSIREQERIEKTQYPVASSLGELAGAVNPIGRIKAVAALPGVGRAVAPAATFPGMVAQQAAMGGVSGLTETGSLDEAAQRAAISAGLGTVLGGTGRIAEKAREKIATGAVIASKEAQKRVATQQMADKTDELNALRDQQKTFETLREAGQGKGLPTSEALERDMDAVRRSISSDMSWRRGADNDLRRLRSGELSPTEVNQMAGDMIGGNLTKVAIREGIQNLPNLGLLSGWGGLISPVARFKLGTAARVPAGLIPAATDTATYFTSSSLLPTERGLRLPQPQQASTSPGTSAPSVEQLNQMFEQARGGAVGAVETPAAVERAPEQKLPSKGASVDLDALFEAGRVK